MHLVKQAGLAEQISADSAGTGSWHAGEPPHRGTQNILRKYHIDYQHTARVIRASDFDTFDYIVAMDSQNLADLRALARTPAHQAKLALMLDYATDAPVRDVPDPYYNGRFEEVYDLVNRGSRGLLDTIIAKHQLAH